MPVSIRISPTFLQSISTFETDLPQQRISSLSFIDFSWRRAKCHSLSSRIWPEHRKAPLDVMDSSSIDSLFFFAVLAPKNQDSNSTDMISHALQTFALHDDSFARLYFLPMSSKGFGLAPHCTPAYLMSDKPLGSSIVRTTIFAHTCIFKWRGTKFYKIIDIFKNAIQRQCSWKTSSTGLGCRNLHSV